MYYISSVADLRPISGWNEGYYNKIGITNSETGIEEIHDNKSVYKFLKEYKLKIYGTYCYGKDKNNMWVFATPMKVGLDLDKSKLLNLLESHTKQHNQWSEYPIADYLASLNKCTIKITYKDSYPEGRGYFTGITRLEKLGDDRWVMNDVNNSFDGTICDSYGAAHWLDIAWCSTRVHELI